MNMVLVGVVMFSALLSQADLAEEKEVDLDLSAIRTAAVHAIDENRFEEASREIERLKRAGTNVDALRFALESRMKSVRGYALKIAVEKSRVGDLQQVLDALSLYQSVGGACGDDAAPVLSAISKRVLEQSRQRQACLKKMKATGACKYLRGSKEVRWLRSAEGIFAIASKMKCTPVSGREEVRRLLLLFSDEEPTAESNRAEDDVVHIFASWWKTRPIEEYEQEATRTCLALDDVVAPMTNENWTSALERMGKRGPFDTPTAVLDFESAFLHSYFGAGSGASKCVHTLLSSLNAQGKESDANVQSDDAAARLQCRQYMSSMRNQFGSSVTPRICDCTKRIAGFEIVAAVSGDLYEAEMLAPWPPGSGLWAKTGQNVLVLSKSGVIRGPAVYVLCISEDVKRRSVTMRNGFQQDVDVITEVVP